MRLIIGFSGLVYFAGTVMVGEAQSVVSIDVPKSYVSAAGENCGRDFGNTFCRSVMLGPDGKSEVPLGQSSYCCSQFGFCGNTPDHCLPNFGCQSQCDNKPDQTYGFGSDVPKSPDNRERCGNIGLAGVDIFCVTPNKYCCGEGGFCGGGKERCEPRKCTSQCDNKLDARNTVGIAYKSFKNTFEVAGTRCGKEFQGAKCDQGMCCSVFGWCGLTEDHCMPPNCQPGFGKCYERVLRID